MHSNRPKRFKGVFQYKFESSICDIGRSDSLKQVHNAEKEMNAQAFIQGNTISKTGNIESICNLDIHIFIKQFFTQWSLPNVAHRMPA